MPEREARKPPMGSTLKSRLTFVLGGARSGKSAYAASLGSALPVPRHFLATTEPRDEEMRLRIAEHRARRGSDWVTHEAGRDLLGCLARIPPTETVVIDCLTMWLTRTILDDVGPVDEALDKLVAALKARGGHRVVVSTEVGLGIVPDNALARAFRDHAGRMHQRLSAISDGVVLVVAGVPVQVK